MCAYVCLPGDGHSSLLARSHGNAALEVMQLAKVLPQRAAALEIPRHIYRTLRHTHTSAVSTPARLKHPDCLLLAGCRKSHNPKVLTHPFAYTQILYYYFKGKAVE